MRATDSSARNKLAEQSPRGKIILQIFAKVLTGSDTCDILLRQNEAELSVLTAPISFACGLISVFSAVVAVIIAIYAESSGFPHFLILFLEVLTISKQEHLINEEIKVPEVRLIGADGEQIGVVPIAKAQELSIEKELDLVMIAPQATPPVCRIMDYGKFRFERDKREKEAKKKQQVIEVKEIQLSCKIGDHDLQTKLNHAHRFLNAGNKVKAVVRFSWRELRHPELGQAVLDKFEAGCEGVGAADKKAVLEGRNLTLFLSPVKK